MKIRLIEPISPSRHLWSKSYFVRLGLPMIGAALVEAGHDVRIFNPQLAPIDWADVYSSDLVGLSSTTSTIPEAYRIARRPAPPRHPRHHRRLARHLHGRRGAASTPTTWPAARPAR